MQIKPRKFPDGKPDINGAIKALGQKMLTEGIRMEIKLRHHRMGQKERDRQKEKLKHQLRKLHIEPQTALEAERKVKAAEYHDQAQRCA